MAGVAGLGYGELFTARAAQLFLVEGHDSILMQSGQFALTLVKNPASQLAVVIAMVGELQWPVGRDSCVVRDGNASFTFTLPGAFTYNLVLQESTTSSADLQRLEHILENYSDWQKPQEEQKQLSDLNRTKAADVTSHFLLGRMLRARRMSAVAKVFSKTLERGAIKVASHVEPAYIPGPLRQQISLSTAFASVDAVTKVVEAVETGGRTLLESVGSGSEVGGLPSRGELLQKQAEADRSFDLTSSSISCEWTLNKVGSLMLFKIITASMAIHSGGSNSGSSSRSGSSLSSGFGRIASSSSFSSKSPTTLSHVESSGNSSRCSSSSSSGFCRVLSTSSFSSKSPATPSHLQSTGSGDVASTALSLQTPVCAGSPSTSTTMPPPPPFFSHSTPRKRHSSMPPPSGPPPAIAHVTAVASSEAPPPFRIYKPRPTPAVPATVAPSPHPFPARPPRFQAPPKS